MIYAYIKLFIVDHMQIFFFWIHLDKNWNCHTAFTEHLKFRNLNYLYNGLGYNTRPQTNDNGFHTRRPILALQRTPNLRNIYFFLVTARPNCN
jgi:hypothetical protein